MMDRGTVRNM